MKKLFFVVMFLVFSFFAFEAKAEEKIATGSAVEATTSAVVERINDLTQPEKSKPRLEMLLDSQKVDGWWGTNFLKVAIREAVAKGVPANTVVLLLLFPLVAALVAFSRQVVGVNGFGIFTPAVLSVAFLSTGGVVGLVLLFGILLVATLGRMIVKRIKMPYLPRLAVLIWLVAMGVLGLLLVSPALGLEKLTSIGIFPILVFVLMVETFIEAQITRSLRTTMEMTLETVILALVAYKVMSAPMVQNQVLLHPEISVVAILGLDYLIGKYKGLRWLEYWRFRKVIKG